MPNLARRIAATLVVTFLFSHFCLAQSAPAKHLDPNDPAPQAEVLILGTYHMDNPGQDVFNMQADDVLAPKRQAEIEQVAAAIERFRPNKIALEWGLENASRLDAIYGEYLAGKRELTRDERQQIGFRLGKKLGLKKLCAIDTLWDFPFPSVQNWAKANGRQAEWDVLLKQTGELVSEENEFLKTHTVLEMLRRMNSAEQVRVSGAFYARAMHFGNDDDPAGARLLTKWYERNALIHTSLLGVLQPGDRVLVIYGAGHLQLLRNFVQNDPTLKLHTLDEFVVTP